MKIIFFEEFYIYNKMNFLHFLFWFLPNIWIYFLQLFKLCNFSLKNLKQSRLDFYTYLIEVIFRFMHRNTRPEPNIRCGVLNSPRIIQNHDHKTDARLRSYPKVLVFVETMYSKLGKDIAELLVHTRIKWVLSL